MPVAKGSTLDPSRTRAAILDAAGPLLYERGLDGLGVAELCTRLGISKQTLYRHFGTKDALVRAVLRARSDKVIDWLTEAVTSAGTEPAAQLTALFAALGRWYAEPGFRGCAMINAATQHRDQVVSPITATHLGRYLDLLTGIATRAQAADPAALAGQLLMLIEGATLLAAHHDTPEAADRARTAALTLLTAAANPLT